MARNNILTEINVFQSAYAETTFQERLTRLYTDLNHQDPEQWASHLYITLRDADLSSQEWKHAFKLNKDRKECLQVLYDLVNAWESSSHPDDFEREIAANCLPQVYHILFIGLVMDRAQALHNMKIPLPHVNYHGMHWYAKRHEPEWDMWEPCLSITEDERESLYIALEDYPWKSTLNCRLYKIVHTKSFGLLQRDPRLDKWTRPCLATFFRRPDDGGPAVPLGNVL